VRAAVRPSTRLLWVETPSNPQLKVTDIAGVVAIARDAEAAHGAPVWVAVDATWTPPPWQPAFVHGVDLVVHATTKYLAGHSDVLGGVVVAAPTARPGDDDPWPRVRDLQRLEGAVAAPFDAWLTLRGLRTLGVRLAAQADNAATLAAFLVAHPAVAEVRYPGLPGHPNHAVAARQMTAFGGMLAFRLRGGEGAARATAASGPVVHARHEPRRGREPDRASGVDRAAGRPDPGRPAARVGGDRARRRPDRGPVPGAGSGGGRMNAIGTPAAEEVAAALAAVAWDPAGLVPVVTQDASSGDVLTVAYANALALARTLETGEAHYWSRSRAELWRKGESSGNVQRVREVRIDCDGDALLYRVDPLGPACHTGERSCFFRAPGGEARVPAEGPVDAVGIGAIMGMLERTVDERLTTLPEGSYVAKLHARGIGYVAQKVVEEAGEAVVAALQGHDEELLGEAADLLFHLTVLLRERGLDLDAVARVLAGRHRAR
jgi:phosphoribosyl-AMP cyclohydrolase / phosphoribosyl-ATP pyrophosphohydrolase